MTSFVVGAFTTTAIAPKASASFASMTTRAPVVVPPPTPQKTGRLEVETIASAIICWGVKGYTASTASALQLRMMAISVEKIKDLMRRPIITIPLAA